MIGSMSHVAPICGTGSVGDRSKVSQRIGVPSGVSMNEMVPLVRSGEDAELASTVARARQGDANAFTELVAVYQRMVHRVAFRMTGSEAESADLAQESFLRAWRSLDQLRNNAGFFSWLHCITVSTFLNAIRSRRRREAAHSEFAERSNPHEAPGESWVNPRVLAALDRLDPDLRAAVVLTTYEGLNHAEASAILGCAETTVSRRVWRARTHLKRWLADLKPCESSAR